MRLPRPCLQCQRLHQDKGDYCHECRRLINRVREADPYRRAKKKLLYGGDYRTRRQRMLATATHCHICNKAFTSGDTITADHLDPGNPNSPLAPAHSYCNSSRGNRPLDLGQ